ncbi:ribosomal protection-like ABC-F family protein [Hespellia stercorisuis]|uniref:Macrolide transport system ATP-binding/permease protein n=1 Tax=Hespellia stercorisuis DSM 15480 TaxID=1121950 RepID=A0A1M6MN21_9FIRM|nr:ABC-F type ribosomal protection protein [Hespellia stercorisuis]SHJ84780.1 macrolide transport system ATP-binding/permease protein [Hespellia stercorisuis DSM 15480]
MLLRAENIQKEYGIQEVFDIERIVIEDGARIGLVGRNGTGKSTLLDVLDGRTEADRGVIKRYCEIARIRQDSQSEGEPEEQMVSRLGLRKSAVESGGEKMRLAIAAAFSRHAPLLFADEPTTNLDIDGIKMLTKMLAGYRGGFVLVSHDRKLLDDVCSQIWELENGQLRIFDGNYSDWAAQKKQEREFQQFEYEQYQKEKVRLNHSIVEVREAARVMKRPPRKMGHSEWMLYKGIASEQQRNVSNRGTAMKSRLDHLEKKEKPAQLPHVTMKGMHTTKIKAKYAAKIVDLTVEFDGRKVLNQAELWVESGRKTFLTGGNGAGKSTLLGALMQRQPGTFITEDAKIGYFSQDLMELQEEKTVLENVLYTAAEPEHICRAVLANLYMGREDLHKQVSVLSGGERVKTALGKLLVSGCNFCILDEPTNHMDLYTMEGLEAMLAEYEGTLLVVSHDRRLTEKLADVVYEVRDGRCRVL